MIQQRPSLVPVNPEFMVNMRIRISPSHPGNINLVQKVLLVIVFVTQLALLCGNNMIYEFVNVMNWIVTYKTFPLRS